MKTVLIIAFSDISSDPRVSRQIAFFKNHYEVVACGYGNPESKDISFVRLEKKGRGSLKRLFAACLLVTGWFEEFYWSQPHVLECIEKLSIIKADLIIANDIDTLPLALQCNGAKVIFDAHEYAPLEFEDRFLFRLFLKRYRMYQCKKYIPMVDALVTVSEGIANLFNKEFGVHPRIVTNASKHEELAPADNRNNTKQIMLIHHGAAIRSRNIELMLDMMKFVDDRFQLNLMLVSSDDSYSKYLKRYASGLQNVNFLSPVPMENIVTFINRFDIGIFLLPPVNMNYRYALPNKLFEFIQARLAVAIGPSEEMKKVVNKYDLGIVAADFTPQSLAKLLNELDQEKLIYYKNRSHRAARELSAETSRALYLSLADQLIETA